jgi:hypothetical protein
MFPASSLLKSFPALGVIGKLRALLQTFHGYITGSGVQINDHHYCQLL